MSNDFIYKIKYQEYTDMELKNRTLSNFADLVQTGECKKFKGRLVMKRIEKLLVNIKVFIKYFFIV